MVDGHGLRPCWLGVKVTHFWALGWASTPRGLTLPPQARARRKQAEGPPETAGGCALRGPGTARTGSNGSAHVRRCGCLSPFGRSPSPGPMGPAGQGRDSAEGMRGHHILVAAYAGSAEEVPEEHSEP